jgi:hypothetical protein
MEDYREDGGSRRRQIRRNIEALQGRLKSTEDPFQQSSIADQLSQLEQERMELDNLFEEEPPEDAEEDAPREQFPHLNRIWARYDPILKECQHLERDVRASILYARYFEDEFLGMFTNRKLRLDVKYSVERDSFYGLFDQLTRSLTHYRTEADRIRDGTYTKQYEIDIFKRKVEMRHALLVEVDWFFRKLARFSQELLNDIAAEQLFCQNPDEELNYSTIDKETVLRGRLVRDALHELFDLASEVVNYVDIPDFQQRPL